MKRGDIIAVSDWQNAFNRRNGLPRYRKQEVLAVLEPGEHACDHGIHGRVWGYLNYAERRIVINNQVGARVNRDRFFWPLEHDAPDPPPPRYAEVSYTTVIRDSDAMPARRREAAEPRRGRSAGPQDIAQGPSQ